MKLRNLRKNTLAVSKIITIIVAVVSLLGVGSLAAFFTNGGTDPNATPTPTPSASPSVTPTPDTNATATPAPTEEPTITPTEEPTVTPTPAPSQVNFTIAADTGVAYITVTTMTTGSFNLTTVDFPFQFSLAPTQSISLNVTAANGYTFKFLSFDDGTLPQSTQPYNLKVSEHPNGCTVTAKFNVVTT